ncbi:unnamed protein product [Lymnaea stagnalis]|uniref:tRNA (carboxymethyluridine(34)-5-O)-methyltransferase n=1 Tax=Lymnaea stagnalis TaxID=6523 RepID=A0AAV2GZI7_LYMST
MDVTKIQLHSKKLLKKLNKIQKNLFIKENIRVSSAATRTLIIQNGGLGNDVKQSELMPLFKQYGEVEEIVMLPRKQYSFVCYAEVSSATLAINNLNGHMLRAGKDPTQNVTLYLLYAKEAPPSVVPSKEIPPGLIIIEDFVDEETERALLKLVNGETEANNKGIMKHRKVLHYGYEFKYSINDVDITDPLPVGIPEQCHTFLKKALKLGLTKHFPDQLTVNQYSPGQGIPPHVDTIDAFEDGILSLSLGSQVVMDFRHPEGKHLQVLLPSRSLIVMTGDSRYVWSHGITPRKSDIVTTASGDGVTLLTRETRTSFTFRKVILDREERKSIRENSGIDARMLPQNDGEAIELERQHVHKVYDDIAAHFSGTRYKPWPRVVDFLLEQPAMSLLADVGCGNGKCLGVNKSLFEIGSDYSGNLANICRSRGFETCVADVTCLPFRSDIFDVVLCIAVIHHMATKERRHKAVSEVVRILRPGGKALIYVWAIEQECNKTISKYINPKKQRQSAQVTKENEREKTIIKDKDELNMETGVCVEKLLNLSSGNDENFQDGEVKTTVSDHNKYSRVQDFNIDSIAQSPDVNKELELTHCCGLHSKHVEEKSCSNEICDLQTTAKTLHVHVNRTQFKEQDMLVPWQLKSKQAEHVDKTKGDSSHDTSHVFHRYYHVFRQGELEAVSKKVAQCEVIKSYYDQGNWCVVLEKMGSYLKC